MSKFSVLTLLAATCMATSAFAADPVSMTQPVSTTPEAEAAINAAPNAWDSEKEQKQDVSDAATHEKKLSHHTKHQAAKAEHKTKHATAKAKVKSDKKTDTKAKHETHTSSEPAKDSTSTETSVKQ